MRLLEIQNQFLYIPTPSKYVPKNRFPVAKVGEDKGGSYCPHSSFYIFFVSFSQKHFVDYFKMCLSVSSRKIKGNQCGVSNPFLGRLTQHVSRFQLKIRKNGLENVRDQ